MLNLLLIISNNLCKPVAGIVSPFTEMSSIPMCFCITDDRRYYFLHNSSSIPDHSPSHTQSSLISCATENTKIQ